jgi:hypothetical protein
VDNFLGRIKSMIEIKTCPTELTVEAFIQSIENKKRQEDTQILL